jgi:hypothetical protein
LSLAKVITTNVHLKEMAELEGNIQKYAERGSITAYERCGWGSSMELLSKALVEYYGLYSFFGVSS